jgi:predicted membrane protein
MEHSLNTFFSADLVKEVFTYVAFTIGFIVSGKYIAPNFKVKVAMILSIIVYLSAFSGIYLETIQSHFFSITIIANIFSIATAFITYQILKHQEEGNNRKLVNEFNESTTNDLEDLKNTKIRNLSDVVVDLPFNQAPD